jgi:hypothetical protein
VEYFPRTRVFVTFEENVMMKFTALSAVLAALAIGAATAGVHAAVIVARSS